MRPLLLTPHTFGSFVWTCKKLSQANDASQGETERHCQRNHPETLMMMDDHYVVYHLDIWCPIWPGTSSVVWSRGVESRGRKAKASPCSSLFVASGKRETQSSGTNVNKLWREVQWCRLFFKPEDANKMLHKYLKRLLCCSKTKLDSLTHSFIRLKLH